MKLFDIVHGDVAALSHGSGDFGFNAETRLVRYVSAERYLDMIEARCGEGDGLAKGYNELSLVTRWDDPYEACLLRADGASDSSEGMKGLCESIQDYYGQCWMLKTSEGKKEGRKKEDDTFESDLIWRAYCPNKDGVRIETTVGAFIDSIRNCLPKGGVDAEDEDASSAFLCRIGRVSYRLDTLKKLLSRCEIGHSPCDVSENIVSSLFVKREQFSDEREVRVVLRANLEFAGNCKGTGLLSFEQGGCRMHDLGFIKGVLVDPRMPRHRAEEVLCRTRIALTLKNDLNGDGGIGRSTLYEWPEFTKAMREIGKMADVNLKFWTELQREYPHDAIINFKNRAVPTVSYWTGLPCGESGCCFAFTCSRTFTRVELYLGKKEMSENKRLCRLLEAQRDAIEQKLRAPELRPVKVDFDPLPGRIASRIFVRYGNVTSDDLPEKQSEIVKWFCTVMPPFARAMKEALARVGMAMHEQS